VSSTAPTSNANTENRSYVTNTTTTRDIGLTGAAAVDVYRYLAETTQRTNQGSFDLSANVIHDLAHAQDTATIATENTLGAIINATQDFSQRAIAAGTGQATPVQAIGPASGVAANAGSEKGILYLTIGALALGVFALFKDK